ncbi:hypothetical protein MKW98_031467 [Papaver atlanticum]|uniref:Uncharacterized protein n=1 Tax=Papaver atlanticum TaxID=357466 RepID=A0AAD4S5F0_9MAGN|nr:hypothetical protein MKW98_031467 [Papaver atlanticum]
MVSSQAIVVAKALEADAAQIQAQQVHLAKDTPDSPGKAGRAAEVLKKTLQVSNRAATMKSATDMAAARAAEISSWICNTEGLANMRTGATSMNGEKIALKISELPKVSAAGELLSFSQDADHVVVPSDGKVKTYPIIPLKFTENLYSLRTMNSFSLSNKFT